jgi:hypothetical protein
MLSKVSQVERRRFLVARKENKGAFDSKVNLNLLLTNIEVFENHGREG